MDSDDDGMFSSLFSEGYGRSGMEHISTRGRKMKEDNSVRKVITILISMYLVGYLYLSINYSNSFMISTYSGPMI